MKSNKYDSTQPYSEYLDKEYGYLVLNGFYNYQEYTNFLSQEAQAGDSKAMEACLYYFGWRADGAPQGLLKEYYLMLTAGAYDIYNTTHLAFLRLFASEKDRKELVGKRVSVKKAYIAIRHANRITNLIKERLTNEEILEALIFLLIDRIGNYKEGERTLRGYMYDMYYLYVARYMQNVIHSKEILLQESRVPEEENKAIVFDKYEYLNENKNIYYLYEKERKELGAYWLAGHTHPYFNGLTREQRSLLREMYYLKIKHIEVAKAHSITQWMLSYRRKKALEKIKENYETLTLEEVEGQGYQNIHLDYE